MTKAAEHETVFDDIYETEISDEDYGFILGPNGELKSVFLPETLPFETPNNIAKILKIFGITDLENIDKDQPVH
jgi:hypothetical protein